MNLSPSILPINCVSRRGRAAFTLAEMMVAMAIFLLVLTSVLYSHLFGLKMYNVTSTKLIASHGARAALNRVRDDIRSGRVLYVGVGTSTAFNNISTNSPHQGNAVQIYPTANTNTFIRYFWDASDQRLKRAASGTTQIEVIASFITNQIVFRAEDYLGNALTNDVNNRIIKMTLDFCQWELPSVQVVGGYFDYYRLQTRITRRTIE
jgi:prepilin-type N-terminal cleavage/methylation domain-containing protein